MTRLAMASLRSRSTSFIAYFISVFLGCVVIGAFATMLQTATGDISSEDRETLVTIGTVVGAWGLVIVLFSVASTLTLTVRQRSGELSLLRSIGATPRQNRRMLLVESVLVTLVASLLAAVPAWLLGAGVFRLLQNGDMVADSVDHHTGFAAIGATSAAVLLVSSLAVVLATRRAAKLSVNADRTDSAVGPTRTSRWRIAAGLFLLAVGVNYAILTVTVMADSDDPFAAMSTSGPACVFTSAGLAVLAPILLRFGAVVAMPVLRLFGAAGHLAAYDLKARTHLLGGILAPVVVFVGMGTGTMYLMGIENKVNPGDSTIEGRNLEMLNYVVAGMISAFAAIMVVNTVAAAVSARRREIGQQRLVGATPEQVRTVLLLEGAVVAVTGVVLGAVASLATILSYSSVKLDRLVPDLGPGIFIGIVVIAVAVVLASTYVATRRAVRPAAIDAVALVGG